MTIEGAYKESERLLEGVLDNLAEQIKDSAKLRRSDIAMNNAIDNAVSGLKDKAIRTVAERLMEYPV